MRSFKTILALVTLLAASPGAHAIDERWYWNASLWKFDDVDVDADGLAIDLGHKLTNWISVQGRLGRTSKEDVIGNLDLGVDYYVSALARVELRYDNFALYGLGGYSYFKFGGSLVEAVNGPDDNDGVAIGLGMALYGTRQTAITIEYMKHYLDYDAEPKAIFLGILHRFNWAQPSF